MKKFSFLSLIIILICSSIAWAYTQRTGAFEWLDDQLFKSNISITGTLDVSGDTSLDAFGVGSVTYAFGTTTHQDAVDVTDVSSLVLDSSSYAITIGGLSGGVANQLLFINVADATETITIENDETSGTQELYLDGAGDVTLNVNEGMILRCDGTDWWEIRR